MTTFRYVKKFIGTRIVFREIQELKKQCFKIFDSNVSMDFIESTVKKQWIEFYRILPTYCCKQDVQFLFRCLKNGEINHKEFRHEMDDTINIIEKWLSALEENMKEAEKQFSNAYDIFFQNNAFLNQPEVKQAFINFLES